MSAMAKLAFSFLSCKPFHVFNMFFPFSFIPFFILYISLVKRGIKEGTQARLRPSRHHIIVLRVK